MISLDVRRNLKEDNLFVSHERNKFSFIEFIDTFDELVKFRKEKSDSLRKSCFIFTDVVTVYNIHDDFLVGKSIVTCNLICIILNVIKINIVFYI